VLNGVVIDIESDPDGASNQRKRRIGIDALHELAFLIAARLMSDRFSKGGG
jgi:hypothetical protein